MNERSIFLEALEKDDPSQRSAYLGTACAGDAALRQRIEALLRSHHQAGSFLSKLAPQLLAEELAVPMTAEVRQGEIPVRDQEEGGLDFLAPPDPEEDALEFPAPADPEEDALDFLTPTDKPGSLGRLGHYEIQEVVGRGGMGIVLRAFDEQLHRVVAIKVMAAPLATSATARKRFAREAQAAAAVSHDHIVTIHAVEEAGPMPYLVMQYVAGLSLQQRLERDGPLKLEEILRIGMQTAAGLAAAHAQGLIHRDIKPANILLENGVERVKITDFGLARALADARVTQSGLVAGTPAYMAPEQARGEPLDARTDLFSLGSVLYAMCTGRSPFHARNIITVLKRVADDTPSPIRERNSQIPDWLVAIIEKLHAKDPSQRFQSAAKVAELLGQHLAHVQHPSVAPLPEQRESVKALEQRESVRALESKSAKRRRWAVAAAVLVLVLGGFSLTEATGVTNLRATVIRILTPDGTLVVEVDDPGVKVTIEGDGGLVITGAGLEEIRLRPGSYKVHADRDGKRVPLEKELISIAKGGREVVKVKLEAPPGQASAKAETRPFAVMGGKGVEVRKYDTLAEAVQGASDGDTIEVRGNGPFVSEPISIQRTALTIRAGEGFRPVIKLSPEAVQRELPLLATNAALVLEGLELHRAPPDAHTGYSVVNTSQAPLRAANCRFRASIWAHQSPICVFRNCEFLFEGGSFGQQHGSGARVMVENCLSRTNGHAIHLYYANAAIDDVSIQITRSTFASKTAPLALSLQCPAPAGMDGPQTLKPIRLEVSRSVFDSSGILAFGQHKDFTGKGGALPPAEAEAMFLRLLEWRGERNLFPANSVSVHWWVDFRQQPPRGPKSLEEWQRFWKAGDADSLERSPRFQGGSLLSRTGAALDQLTPEDFRLRPDSAGYRAGKDGKDLGADVDLVGPGPAYERWKKTTEYQQWLKDSGQLREPAAAVPDRAPFAVLTAKGIPVRAFAILAEAVAAAHDGDIIEVRGNGPFVIKPIVLDRRTLTIRAGAGFRPVIKADPNEPGAILLDNSGGSLALEGLEFQWLDAPAIDQAQQGKLLLVCQWGTSRLRVANCRFRMNRREGFHTRMQCIAVWTAASCQVRNCQFVVGGRGTVGGGGAVSFTGSPQGELLVDNCLMGVQVVGLALYPAPTTKAVLKRNTCLTPESVKIAYYTKIDPPREEHTLSPLQIQASANIFGGAMTFWPFLAEEETLSAAEAAKLLKKMAAWREDRNLYSLPDDRDLLRLESRPSQKSAPPAAVLRITTLADWKSFWGMEELDSQRGQAKFQGGDVVKKAGLTPELLTPDDFRLRPDSPGYRAGKDGKDLGADVDLVGPGPAYERWKKTPEYQQWLKETGQIKAEAPKPEAKAFALMGGNRPSSR